MPKAPVRKATKVQAKTPPKRKPRAKAPPKPKAVTLAAKAEALRKNHAADEAKRTKALTDTLVKINKKYGAGTVKPFIDPKQEAEVLSQIECVSTGVQELDNIISGGNKQAGRGLPRGRVIELYGPESSGKTTLTLQIIAAYQKAGHVCAFIDAEHALDPNYAKHLGVDMHKLLFSQPDSGEQALDAAVELVKSCGVGLVVVDSVAALVPLAEQEGPVGKSYMGLQARLMSQGLRKLCAAAFKTGTTIVFINQIRMKIGVMFGNPETTTGGHALKFYASVRLDIRKIKTLKKGDKAIGIRCSVKTVKNKIVMPFQQCFLDITGGDGITRAYANDPTLKSVEG